MRNRQRNTAVLLQQLVIVEIVIVREMSCVVLCVLLLQCDY